MKTRTLLRLLQAQPSPVVVRPGRHLSVSARAETLDEIKKAEIGSAIGRRDPAVRHDRRQDAADRLGTSISPG